MPLPEGYAPASPWRRFMSFTYEGVILFGIVFFFGYAFSAVTQYKGEAGPLHVAFQVWMFLVLGIYFTYFWSQGRRTLPMKTLSVALLGPDGRPAGVVRSAMRYAVAAIMPAAALAAVHAWSGWFVLGLFVPLASLPFDRKRRTLYDLACGTWLAVVPVVRTPASSSPRPAS